jgi:hypothetical protein
MLGEVPSGYDSRGQHFFRVRGYKALRLPADLSPVI